MESTERTWTFSLSIALNKTEVAVCVSADLRQKSVEIKLLKEVEESVELPALKKVWVKVKGKQKWKCWKELKVSD